MEKVDWKKIAVGGGWNLGDFEYKDNAVTGLSEEGKAKFRENKNLVLPNLIPIEEAKSFKDLKPVEVIGSFAFSHMGLESIFIPRTVKVIRDYAFEFNDLTNINLQEGIESIKDFAFSQNNITEVTFPKSLKSIGRMILIDNCVKKVVVKGRFKNFKYPLTGNEYTKILSLEDEESDEEDLAMVSKVFSNIKILDLNNLKNVKKIPTEAFTNMEIREVIFPPNIERIGFRAFRNNKIKNIVIPDSVKIIEDEAFIYNPAVSLKLGNSVVKIGKDSFPRNEKMEEELFRNALKN